MKIEFWPGGQCRAGGRDNPPAGRAMPTLGRNRAFHYLRLAAEPGNACRSKTTTVAGTAMQSLSRFGLAALTLVAAVSLAACSSSRTPAPQYRAAAPARPAAAPYRQPAQAYRQAAPAYAPAASGRTSESLLRLRAGLNVAALSCRGRGMPAVIPAYGRILTRHRTLLASTYRTETQRLGVGWLDRQNTMSTVGR